MIEAAASGRSKCKGCKKPIAQGELRFGDEVPGNFDGVMTFWYHLPCAVTHRPEQFRADLNRRKKPLPDQAALEAALGGATIAVRVGRMRKVEHAPTGRATCQLCDVPIAKDSLRVVVLREEVMGGTAFIHVGCAGAWAGGGVDTQLLAKAARGDKATVTAILASAALLDGDARGKQLERDTQQAKKPAAEISVLADWLEEQGSALPADELAQLLAARKKLLKKKR
jgi:poly(ADP-ribose) polymerase-like protein